MKSVWSLLAGVVCMTMSMGSASAQCGGEAEAATPAPQRAEVGKTAPDFTLTDVDGKSVSLSDYKGKTVVLEWFNPGCPFVKRVHLEKGPMPKMAKEHLAGGGVWLAINSGAAGKQGAGVEANQKARKDYAISWPILLDETGAVGTQYGAVKTPQVYVIDGSRTLVYAGGVDSTKGGGYDGKAYTNFMQDALDAVKAGKAVAKSETPAWGCGVKYGK